MPPPTLQQQNNQQQESSRPPAQHSRQKMSAHRHHRTNGPDGPSHSQRKPGVKQKPADILVPVRYSNTLPDIPFEPKFLQCPFVDVSRFVEYKQTTLERNYKHDILTEIDLGVKVDLINPDTYYCDVDTELKLHPLDERLVEEDVVNPQDSKRSQQHSKVVPWMRKTEYISSEFNRYGTASDRQETRVGYSIKKRFTEDIFYKDRQSQIDAIRKTFEEVASPVQSHYSKKDVYPVEEHFVMPDFDLWKYPFAQVLFDSDPSLIGANVEAHAQKMGQALIRGMMDESGEQFVAYFLPTDETVEKRQLDSAIGRPFNPDEEYEYKMAREYNWTVKNKASKGYEQENYFLVLRDQGAFYNELETRVRLTRRRAKEGQPKVPNSKLLVKNRDEDAQEVRQQEERQQSLLHPYETIEEEVIAEDEQATAVASTTADAASAPAEVDATVNVAPSAAVTRDSDDEDVPMRNADNDDSSDEDAARPTATRTRHSSSSSDDAQTAGTAQPPHSSSSDAPPKDDDDDSD